MTAAEMKEAFNVYYNNIDSNVAPGLDDYEISLFLTRAQEDIATDYGNKLLNKSQVGMEGSRRRQFDLSSLIHTQDFTPNKAGCIELQPDTILQILNEEVIVLDRVTETRRTLQVIPLTAEVYSVLMSRPYPYPPKNIAWRMLTSGYSSTIFQILVGPNQELVSYTVRYVRKPGPIITDNIGSLYKLSINGVSNMTNCTLPEAVHMDIVIRAAELAKAVYTGTLNDMVALGQISQTQIGAVSSQSSKKG